YGRTTQTQVTTDPEGIDYTDIAYDAGGRKASVSNPYRSTLDPTYGVTNYYYDALGRLTSVGQPDGSEVTTSHVGNSTTATDEAGNQRRSFFDGLGRLIQVDEPSPLVSATSGSGSISVSGSEQSTTVASAPGVGSVTMSGSERSTQTTSTAVTGTVTITGAEQSTYYYPCGVSSCPTLLYDSGTVSVTVNGVTASAGYGQGDTSSSVASYLASAINSNASIPVTATIGGSVITLTAKVAGASTNYPLSATASSSYPQYFPSASFRPSPSGSTLTGGANAQTLYDTGTVTITVNGSTASTYSYGQADTATTIASGLVTRFSSSYVTATASGTVINLTAKTSGSGTNYPLSTSVTYDTNHFSS